MDIAFLSSFTEGSQQVDYLDGDKEKVAFEEGLKVPLVHTYCTRVTAGAAPGVVPDAAAEPHMIELGAEEYIGCYLGAPVILSDGRVYGMLCCVSKEPNHALDAKDEALIKLLADSLAVLVESHGANKALPSHEHSSINLSLWFARVLQAPSAARAALSVLDPYLDPQFMATLRLLISELVTNAVRHAGHDDNGAVGLDVHLAGDYLHCVVADPGPGFAMPAEIKPHEDKPGGFGLLILDAIADEWGLSRDQLFRVWFDIKVDNALR